MEINYPQTILTKKKGKNPSEELLATLCDATFLKLWSFSGPMKNDRKELCDLLVVFDNHIIIFSIKDYVFKNSNTEDELRINWDRWYRKTVSASARQVYGAERWLKNNKDALFIDNDRQSPFPFELPDLSTASIHRIVVALGASDACKEFYGGSSSLMIHYSKSIINNQKMPFSVEYSDFNKGFIHVFDDFTLKLLLSHLDTAQDFITYLIKKEDFIIKHNCVMCCGEEDLLALYLQNYGEDNNHDFLSLEENDLNASAVYIAEGEWVDFSQGQQILNWHTANKVSYIWDDLITKTLHNVMKGKSQYITPPNLNEQEKLLRHFANTTRFQRRMLAQHAVDLENKPITNNGINKRLLHPPHKGDPYYLFVVVGQPSFCTDEEYRTFRMNLLEDFMLCIKSEYRDAKQIIAIAWNPRIPNVGSLYSEDLLYLDCDQFTDDNWKAADDAYAKMTTNGLWGSSSRKMYTTISHEYPSKPPKHKMVKGKDRNKPCLCGSRKKTKNCCYRL